MARTDNLTLLLQGRVRSIDLVVTKEKQEIPILVRIYQITENIRFFLLFIYITVPPSKKVYKLQ